MLEIPATYISLAAVIISGIALWHSYGRDKVRVHFTPDFHLSGAGMKGGVGFGVKITNKGLPKIWIEDTLLCSKDGTELGSYPSSSDFTLESGESKTVVFPLSYHKKDFEHPKEFTTIRVITTTGNYKVSLRKLRKIIRQEWTDDFHKNWQASINND